MKPAQMTAWQLKEKIQSGQISCREIMVSVLETIKEKEPQIKAYITLRPEEELLAEAEAADKRWETNDSVRQLEGLPVAIKDSICTKGLRTTAGSRMLENFIPPYDAFVVEQIRNAGGIIIGKTNLDEFCMGSSTENSAFHITCNPHDTDYVPGGTSGGSAAAVAADETILAIGSDTGGSIRQPASFCGCVGFKPTYGRVSRFGLIAYGSSLDQIGPLTKDVKDAALLMNVICGYDKKDSTSIDQPPPDYMAAIENPDAHLRIGVPGEYFSEGLDNEVRKHVESAIDLMAQNGHEIISINLPHTDYAVAAYYIIVCAEASSNLARYDGCKYGFRDKDAQNILDMYVNTRTSGFGTEVQRRIILGTYVLSSGYYDAYYLKAAKVRTLFARDFEQAFEQCDVIVHPVAPTAAFRIGEKMDNPLEMYLQDIYSAPANLVGLPAVSIPCGQTTKGLPIGIQIAGPHLAESTVFSAAVQMESLIATANIK